MYDLSAWKVDDKAWMKARRAQWKEVKKSLDETFYYLKKGRDYRHLKSFFLTGRLSEEQARKDFWQFNPETPLRGIETSVMLECWLTADQRPENWEAIQRKNPLDLYWDSRHRFREMFAKYPETGTIFGGLEKRLYEFFTPTRCRFEDYKDMPHMEEESFDGLGSQVFTQIGRGLLHLFGDQPRDLEEIEKTGKSKFRQPNVNCLAQYALHEWVESIPPAWRRYEKKGINHFKFLVRLVKLATLISRLPDEHNPVQVAVANEMLTLLENTKGLPDQVYELVAQGKQQAEAELAK